MEDKKPFIKENVNRKNLTRTAGVRRVFIIIGLAVLFGVVASVTAVLFRPVAEKLVGSDTETETQAQTLVIPRDDPDATAVSELAQVETEAAAGTEAGEKAVSGTVGAGSREGDNISDNSRKEGTKAAASETEPVSSVVRKEIESYRYSKEQLDQMLKDAASLCNTLDKSVVTVKAYTNGTDWFDNILEKEGAFSGIVVAETVIHSIILTTDKAVQGADSLKIEWANGFEQKAYIRSISTPDGLAILAVNKSDMSEATRKLAVPVKLGNSFRTSRGDALFVLGSPKGMTHSIIYTLASYKASKVSVVDGITALIYGAQPVNCTRGSWVVNTSGELVGWATNHYSADEADTTDVIACISDYKSILERMINGSKYPYMGIVPVEVNDDMKNTGMPDGVYVSEVAAGSPAYEAGIQPGDVISRMEDEEITGVEEFIRALEKYEPGDTVRVLSNRDGREEYKQIEYSVILTNR